MAGTESLGLNCLRAIKGGQMLVFKTFLLIFVASLALAENLEQEVKNLLNVSIEAQGLVSSFDMHLKIKAHSHFGDFNSSQLRCDLLHASQKVYRIEESIYQKQRQALAVKDTKFYTTFLASLQAEASTRPDVLLAKAHMIRKLKSDHISICQNEIQCIDFMTLPKNFLTSKKAPFDLNNDQSMQHYKEKTLAQSARHSKQQLKSLPEGDCFSNTYYDWSKANITAYDWQSKSFTGLSLPMHHFVITYDDGPHPRYTKAIADQWTHSSFPRPVFFWLAQNALSNPEQVRYVRSFNYEVALHSYDHPDLGNLARAQDFSQLDNVNKSQYAPILQRPGTIFKDWKEKEIDFQILGAFKILSTVLESVDPGGPPITKFRLPYGSGVGNPLLGDRLEKLNLKHYFWAIDSLDWQDKNPLSVYSRIRRQMKSAGKGIILMHDIHPQTVQATTLLLRYFNSTHSDQVVPLDDIH